jgi:cell wall-associated NlpC family hydrolase
MIRILKQIISILIIILLFLSFSETAFSASNQTGIVSVDILNLRQSPLITSKILDKLSKGMQVSITEKKDDWYKVNIKGLTGWVSSRYVSIAVEKTQKGTINSFIVNLRSTAEISASIIGKLPKGEMVSIIQTKGNWYEVRRENGNSGWVRMDCITFDKGNTSHGMNDAVVKEAVKEHEIYPTPLAETGIDASTNTLNNNNIQESSVDITNGMSNSINSPDGGSNNPNDKTNESLTSANSTSMSSINASTNTVPPNVDEIINFAKSLLGAPYIYGGISPDGFDCSGFTSYVYEKLGIQLERTSSDQAKQGDEVAKENLKPGNLVFFDTNGSHTSINHAGIYIGDGKFIHASSGTSTRCVIISDITAGYYADNYITARSIW